MKTKKVIIIDYGIGNVFSVIRAIERLGFEAELTSDPSKILCASRVILPGVGAFGRAANKLRDAGLDYAIYDYVDTGKPFLGICVGMQLLLERGEEFGQHRGLGIIPGNVSRISTIVQTGRSSRVPLIGWTSVKEARYGAWEGTPFSPDASQNAFYFVHSYQAVVTDSTHCIAVHRHGDAEIVSAIRSENVLGVQFHPERSAETGQRFLFNFIAGKEMQ